MIDVHAHFAEEGYEFPAEWDKIKAAGVNTVILASDTLAHAKWHSEFAKTHNGCYFTVGVHPSELENFGRETVETCEEWAADERCVAVGEIGLDYHYPDPDKRAQRAAFEAQLAIAEELSLPVEIHSRDACADTLAILREHYGRSERGFLMHCYSYGAENLPNFLELGAYFSFGGVVCFKNARRAVESVRLCPLERILSETDSPYLSPFRGEKNSPSNIPVIVEKLAELKEVTLFEMVEAIRSNAARLFPKLKP